jgi:hypothetical protein
MSNAYTFKEEILYVGRMSMSNPIHRENLIVLAVVFFLSFSYFFAFGPRIVGYFTQGVATQKVIITPSEPGDFQQWQPTGYPTKNYNYDYVDERGEPDISDRVISVDRYADKIDLYEMENMIAPGAAVKKVTIYFYAKIGTNDAKCFQPYLKLGGRYYGGFDFCTDKDYKWYSQSWRTNPVTGSEWTLADVNNMQAGMRTVSDNNRGGNVAQMYVEVELLK